MNGPVQEVRGRVDDPVALALAVFRGRAQAAGLRIEGRNRAGTAPAAAATLAHVASPNLPPC